MMHYISLKFHITQPYLLDTATRGSILNGCWILAAAGSAIIQMLLLAQAWHQSQQAAPTACVASAWLIGALMAGMVNNALQRGCAPPASIWGIAFLGCTVAWRTWAPTTGLTSTPAIRPDLVARILPILGLAFFLGLLSSLWLGQQRSWGVVGESTMLFRNTACLLFGLVIVWCYPEVSHLVGLACLLPLLSLDLFTPSFTPRIPLRGMTGTLLAQQADPARWTPLRLERQPGMGGWWRTYLVHRGYALHALLASGTAILLGALWSALPTPFAGELANIGELNKLIALLVGQVIALAVGLGSLNNSRSLIDARGRLVPLPRQTCAWRRAWYSLVGLSFGLVLLGLPGLQAPVWLGISSWIYTLALTTWSTLLPRLRPSITTQVLAQRHVTFGRGRVMRSGYLAYEQAIENRVNLVLNTWEGLMTAVCAPAVGLLIDHMTGGRTLIFMGLALAWFLVAVLVANPARIADQLFARPVDGRSMSVERAA
jgi:hypothetical protein